MSKQMIKEMSEGDRVATFLQVEEAGIFNFLRKQGKYAIFTLKDRTGAIKGVCWERGEEYYNSFSDGAVVHVEGRVEAYKNQLQIVVDSISEQTDMEYDPADFMVSTTLDVEQLYEYLKTTIDNIRNRHMKQLLESFYGDPEFEETFKKSPAAKTIHHSYLGGLAEHTTNCLRLAETLCDIYPQLDRDLLLTGVMLHDIGKTIELTYDQKVDYTDQGRLLGHIVLGHTMVLDKIRQIEGFPQRTREELLHLIISHHGENATGSPKRPKMAEACALHFLENLDAQTKRFLQLIENAAAHGRDSNWTAYDRLLDRYLYRKPVDEEQ